MYGIDAYRQQKAATISRVDLLLMAYDGVIERIEKAKDFFKKKNELQANAQLVRCQAILVEMMSGLDPTKGELPRKTQSLYIFVLQSIGLGDKLNLDGALKVLRKLREGIHAVREEAVEAENAGIIPSLDMSTKLRTSG